MNKREYCESRESVAYYSGLNGLEIKGIEYGINDFVYCVSGCWYGGKAATVETLQNPVVKIGGWAFSLREFCRVYWVKVRYYGIMELYAPNKSAIYSVLGKYHVLKIQEVL